MSASPAKPIREALVDLARDLDRIASTNRALAAGNAIDALDGDQEARWKAKYNLGQSEAYKKATQMVDEVRQRLERGEVG